MATRGAEGKRGGKRGQGTSLGKKGEGDLRPKEGTKEGKKRRTIKSQ